MTSLSKKRQKNAERTGMKKKNIFFKSRDYYFAQGQSPVLPNSHFYL